MTDPMTREERADSILGDMDEFIANIDHVLDGSADRHPGRRGSRSLVERIEEHQARERGQDRSRRWSLARPRRRLASAVRWPFR